MRSKKLYVSIVMVVLSALVTTNSQTLPGETWRWTTPGTGTGLDLNMKMITVSANKGPISFYSPYFSPDDAFPSYTQLPDPIRPDLIRPYRTPPYPTRHYPTRHYPTRPYPTRHYPTRHYPTRPYPTRPYPTQPYPTRHYPTRHYPTRPYYTTPWTTGSPTAGVSVCLRYMTDEQANLQTLFLLSKSSSSPLRVAVSNSGYWLTFGVYRTNRLYLKPYLKLWPNIEEDIWTRVCITVDSVKNVAQVFSGSNMSIRKTMSARYGWTGQPVIDFFSFDGQVTDVQIWDYPLRYREVLQYMDPNAYGPCSGSVLTWSYISYTSRGKVLVEDSYEWQEKRAILKSKGKKWRHPKGEKNTRKFYNKGESKRKEF
ncbi:uncharacterized protein LOC131968302 [Centropristis striata]|uniref:uncharacterized protein LOC131968302 n=1 Tax=Centropristis striata TaxID=184440 RepID=UPI0027DF8C1F|nr:uncharacterized protein LOC131968302 [Centropristis striata]